MGKGSKIEWTHHTFNPWWGCVKVSPGCAACYAEGFAKRTGNNVWGRDTTRRLFGEKHWAEPVKWNMAAALSWERARVFCASMADVFEDNPGLDGERERLWDLIDRTPFLDWLLLTKRPENMPTLAPSAWQQAWPSNVWAGTSVEDQKRADERIPALLQVPAVIHFLSCEPLLGPVDLTEWLWEAAGPSWAGQNSSPDIAWIIVGGESGSKARAMHPAWARALQDQCQASGTAYFFKQWGEWGPASQIGGRSYRVSRAREYQWGDGTVSYAIGKERAGRELDGREWNEFPREVDHAGT